MFTKDMVIKDKHLIVKQPIIQFTVNNKLFINNNNNENKTQNKVIKNNKRLKADKNLLVLLHMQIKYLSLITISLVNML